MAITDLQLQHCKLRKKVSIYFFNNNGANIANVYRNDLACKKV